MGNCINHEAMVSWAEVEDRTWVDFRNRESSTARNDEKLEDDWSVQREASSGVKPANTKVKIKVTKKQLEELLRHIDGGALPVQQVLGQLLIGGGGDVGHAAAHWRPSLHSIPETSDS